MSTYFLETPEGLTEISRQEAEQVEQIRSLSVKWDFYCNCGTCPSCLPRERKRPPAWLFDWKALR